LTETQYYDAPNLARAFPRLRHITEGYWVHRTRVSAAVFLLRKAAAIREM